MNEQTSSRTVIPHSSHSFTQGYLVKFHEFLHLALSQFTFLKFQFNESGQIRDKKKHKRAIFSPIFQLRSKPSSVATIT